MRANYEQVRQDMINAGYITDQEFAQDIVSLDNPAFMMPSPIMWTAWDLEGLVRGLPPGANHSP
jgi:hypothetical protein